MMSVKCASFRSAVLTFACVAMAAGCAGDSGNRGIVRVTVDGVSVVSNPAQLGAAPTLELSDTILRDIGGLKENEADEFNHNISTLSGLALSDGGLAVIDQFRVHLFDSTGQQVAVVGRAGLGPNEFVGLEDICRMRGDTLIVFDQRRVSVLSPQGEIVRQSTVPDLSVTARGCFEDGTVVSQSFSRTEPDSVMISHAVRRRDDGSILDTLGMHPVLATRGIGQFMLHYAHGQFLYISDPRRNEVRRYRQDGSLDQIVRMADKPRTMDAKNAQRWLGGAAPMAGSGASAFASRSNKTVWPFYRAIKVDGTGRLWVRNFPEDDTAPDRWTVYDTSGALIGSLDIPRSPARAIANPRRGYPSTMPGQAPELIDTYGDFVILRERDSQGAAHFVTRRLLKIDQETLQ